MADLETYLATWTPLTPGAETDLAIREMIAKSVSPQTQERGAKAALRTRPGRAKAEVRDMRKVRAEKRRPGILDAVVLAGAAVLLVVAAVKYSNSSSRVTDTRYAPIPPTIPNKTPVEEGERPPEKKIDDGFTDAERTRIATLIQDLSSEKFEVREAASKELKASDERVLPLLEALLKSSDAEVAHRAGSICDAIRAQFDSVLLNDGSQILMVIGSEDYVRVFGRARGKDVSIPSWRVKEIRHAHESEEYATAMQKFSEGPSSAVGRSFTAALDELKKANAPWAMEYCSYYLARCAYDRGHFKSFMGMTGTQYFAPSKNIADVLEASPRSRFMPECVAMLPRCFLGEGRLDAAKAAVQAGLERMTKYREDTEHLPEYARIAEPIEVRLKDLRADIQELQALQPSGDVDQLRLSLHIKHYLAGNADEQKRSGKILREEYSGETLNALETVIGNSKDEEMLRRAKALIKEIKADPNHHEIKVTNGLIERGGK